MVKRKMMSRRQPSLPGLPDIPEKLEIELPNMPMWEQIDGDMDPSAHGGTIARVDGDYIELFKIQPVVEYVGEKEAAEVGFPFWTREASFDLSDLDPSNKDVKSALDFIGMDNDGLEEITPTQRALTIASALLDYGHADEGPAGWSKDMPFDKVKWSSGKIAGPEYLEDEDEEFRQNVLGWGDIQSKLEEEAEKMADESAATSESTPGDELLEEHPSLVIVAEFGDAVAVNGDIETEKTMSGVEKELEADGYENLEDLGGNVPTTEAFAYGEHLIRRVAKELDYEESVVKEAAEALDWWAEEIPHSTSGWTSFWAKPESDGGTANEARGRRDEFSKRRSPRRSPVDHYPVDPDDLRRAVSMYTPAQVFINGRYQVSGTITPSHGIEAEAKTMLTITRAGDLIEVKQGENVWAFTRTKDGISKSVHKFVNSSRRN
jgi:hypothetical protein